VIEGKSEEEQQTPQRVGTPAVDSVEFVAVVSQLTVVAKRALAPALEDSEERPVEIGRRAAVFAAKGCLGQNPEKKTPAATRSMAPAFVAFRHLRY
jgi:hypothetical protein